MKLIKGANILHGGKVLKRDILFDEVSIKKIAENISEDDHSVINGEGLFALPGLVDVHVHLREPGGESKETIKTGTLGAAAGGFTTIVAMPNITPSPDNVDVMKRYIELINKEAVINVIPCACITKGSKGKELVDIKALNDLGCTIFSDDGVGVQNDDIMLEAMKKSEELGIIIVAHTEDMKYRKPGACIHEGNKSEAMNLVGIPSACEYEQLARDLKLVEKTNAHYHCCHMSTKESVELIKRYKEKGLDVTGEVTVHHLLLTDEDVKGPNWKMNPPLRTEEDRLRLIEGCNTGNIDIIANDHAPHTEEEKGRGMVESPFGIATIEDAFPLLYTNLVLGKEMTLERLIELMSTAPAKRFGMESKGKLEEGYDSDILLVNLQEEFVIDKSKAYSKGKNTPFDGWKCFGKVKQTYVNGVLRYEEE